MIARRELLGAGALAGVLGVGGGEADAGGAQAQRTEDELRAITEAINRLREELQRSRSFAEINQLREAQKVFLRANFKLPDFIDAGADLWFAVYDWHVRWQQPITLGRDPNGRQTLFLLQTAVVLRHDTPPNFMSLPYDNR